MTGSKVRIFFLQAILGIILALTLVNSYDRLTLFINDNKDVTDWFVPSQLHVPDIKQGENPFILWDRTIKQPFTADWIVSVQLVSENGTTFNACYGNGLGDYYPGKSLPEKGVTLEWFVGHDCDLEPGTYRLEAVWVIHRDGFSDTTVKQVSNLFRVSA